MGTEALELDDMLAWNKRAPPAPSKACVAPKICFHVSTFKVDEPARFCLRRRSASIHVALPRPVAHQPWQRVAGAGGRDAESPAAGKHHRDPGGTRGLTN